MSTNAPQRDWAAPRGLVVTGAHPRCGKSVACAGLAGVLNQLGFHTQAMKPLSFQPDVSIRKGYEQAFFDRLVPPLQAVEVFSVSDAASLHGREWQRLLESARKRVYPYLLETPGNVASPIRYENREILDAIDLAKTLEVPLLVVCAKQPDVIAVLAPVFSYLWHRDAQVSGWLAVETIPTQAPQWDLEVLYLRSHYDIPYLGEIAYSPSISVEALHQGNLLRNTELGIDLLPIQQALDLRLPL